MKNIKKIVDDDLFEWIRDIRRTIHQWPELAFKEEKTAEFIAQTLRKLGIRHRTGIAGTGVVGRLFVGKDAPTIALRADMDALPVTENTGLSFSSQNPGVMHACGHDGHIAMVLGAAVILKERSPGGNVVFIFQPAEEGEGGALPMIEAGVLEGVDMIFSGHIERHHQVGQIGVKWGVHTAYTDAFEIKITGRGGHAARPHETVDAVLIASRLVLHLQEIISREIDPVQPAVLSVGYIKAGSVFNVIADKAHLKGTIRTTDEDVRTQIIEKIRKLSSSFSIYYDAEIAVNIKPGYPPIVNEGDASLYAIQVAEKLLGKDKVLSIQYPSLGGEDFAYYQKVVPGCFVRFGGGRDGQEKISSHSPVFDFDEEVLRIGAAYFSEVVRYAVKKLSKK